MHLVSPWSRKWIILVGLLHSHLCISCFPYSNVHWRWYNFCQSARKFSRDKTPQSLIWPSLSKTEATFLENAYFASPVQHLNSRGKGDQHQYLLSDTVGAVLRASLHRDDVRYCRVYHKRIVGAKAARTSRHWQGKVGVGGGPGGGAPEVTEVARVAYIKRLENTWVGRRRAF